MSIKPPAPGEPARLVRLKDPVNGILLEEGLTVIVAAGEHGCEITMTPAEALDFFAHGLALARMKMQAAATAADAALERIVAEHVGGIH